MGNISNYVRVLAAKLQDVFVCDQTDSNVTTTKSVTVEQIGDAICGEQVHSDLKTDDQTIIGGINENKDKVGDLSQLSTSVKSSLVGAVNEVARYTPVYGNTASGAIATFDTSLALPLQDLQIAINAVQSGSGTPSPDNVRPISGFTGANIKIAGSNLWDEVWEVQGTFIWSKNYISVKPNTSYYRKSPSNIFPRFYDNSFTEIGTGIWGKDNTFTTPANASYMKFMVDPAYGTTYNNDISINYPATDTAYHPYNANSTTTAISWQDEAGTVYGGSLDVTSGVLTVTHKGLSINSSSNFVSFSVGTANANAIFNLTDASIETSGVGSKKGAISSTGQENPLYWSADRKNETPDNGNMSFAINGNGTTVRFYITENFANISTIDDFKNAFTATTLVYPLATPTTYQLTPTQISAIVGTNNVFTDTNGDTSVIYACSLKDYIDSQ